MEEEGRGKKRKKSRGRKLVMKNEMDRSVKSSLKASDNFIPIRIDFSKILLWKSPFSEGVLCSALCKRIILLFSSPGPRVM
jgi:hypothetical protein